MQVSRMVQAVALMLIVALAASCAASKEYSSKLFKQRTDTTKETPSATALRFLELDKLDADKENWVSTDIIMGRDTVSSTAALDNLAKTFPAKQFTTDTTTITKEEKTVIASVEKKIVPASEAKKTEVVNPAIAKNENTGVRNKRTRTEKLP